MALVLNGSGITSANIADGTIVNADVADVAASKLTGALPAIDGSALTSLTSSQMPAGSVLQVQYGESQAQASVTSTTLAVVTVSLTRRKADSFFILKGAVFYAPITEDSNNDNLDPGVGFKVNGSTIIQAQNTVHNHGGFYGSDVPLVWSSQIYNGNYEMQQKTGFAKSTLSGNIGDVVTFEIWVDAGSGGLYVNRPINNNSSRGASMLEVMEIAQ